MTLNDVEVIRQDIRDLKLSIDTKFTLMDERIRDNEKHTAASAALARAAMAVILVPLSVGMVTAVIAVVTGR